MWIILSSNLLNILGNYLLIFGKWGCPELGLFGAGLSTLLSRVYMLVALWVVLRSSRDLRAVYRACLKRRFLPAYFGRLFRLGLPIGIQTGVEAGAWTFAIIIVTPLGEDPLAVHQIVCTLTNLGFLVYYGIGAATTILVSAAHARGDQGEIRRVVGSGLILAELSAFAVLLGIILTRGFVGRIFSDDVEIILMTALAVIPMALYQPADALQVIYSNALRGMEDVKPMALYACLVHLGLAPCLSTLFGFGLGLDGGAIQLTAIWSAFPISLLVLGLILRWRFRRIVARLA